jgi:diacylglycerol kinase (CTP)
MIQPIAPHIHFKKRSDLHLARKAWHVITVFLMFLTYRYTPEIVSKSILVIASCLFVPVDIFRHRFTALNDFLIHFFRPVLRVNEVNRLAGTTYLLIGVMLVTFLLPRPIVSLTLLFLAFADPFASFIGIRYGKDKIFGQKTIQGFVAAYLACFFCCLVFLYSTNIPQDRLIVFSLIAGLVGALAELVPVGNLDDNLTMPVLSGAGLYLLFLLFGFLETVL